MNTELTRELEILCEKYNSPENLLQISDFLIERNLIKFIITPDSFESILNSIYNNKSWEEKYKYLEILEQYINVDIDTSYSLNWD